MGRAFEYRKATKLKRWGHMAKTFTKLGKQIAIAVKAGGPEPENNPTLLAMVSIRFGWRQVVPRQKVQQYSVWISTIWQLMPSMHPRLLQRL